MVSPRIRDVTDKKEMDRVIDDFQTQNYVIKEQGNSTTLLKEKSWGSAAGWIVTLIIAVILAFFTVGFSFIIPIAYAIYAHYNSKEVLLRIAQ